MSVPFWQKKNVNYFPLILQISKNKSTETGLSQKIVKWEGLNSLELIQFIDDHVDFYELYILCFQRPVSW